MRIIRCEEKHIELVDEILKDDSVFDMISDDGTSQKDTFTYEEVILNRINYVLLIDYVALVIFHPFCQGTYFVHVACLPKCRGKEMVKYSIAALQYIFNNTDCVKIIATIPSYNVGVYALSLKAGMKKEGRITKAWRKDGKSFDLIVLGLRKEDMICPEQ